MACRHPRLVLPELLGAPKSREPAVGRGQDTDRYRLTSRARGIAARLMRIVTDCDEAVVDLGALTPPQSVSPMRETTEH